MAIKIDPRVNCRHCGKKMDARMIQAARLEWENLLSVVFAHTLPVFICPACDTAPPRQAKGILHAP